MDQVLPDQVLLSETIGAVRLLTMNRPERLNALDDALLAALNAAFAEVAGDAAVRAVLLTGAGRGFCAGADLTQNLGGGLGPVVETYYNPLVRKIRALGKPVVVAVNGVAAGAGMNLALAGDVVVAGRGANFTQAFVRIGLLPDAGGTYFLPRLAGDGRARALAMLGETISAEQAQAYGLVWQVFDDEVLMTEALTIATNLAAKPAGSLAAIKQALNASAGNTLDAQLDLERDLQDRLGGTADFAEGVRAFVEKRPAKFND
jgi:2-(1,2-epoxy-1,2-dihydrophenyl)acetyl-CoA isomerase